MVYGVFSEPKKMRYRAQAIVWLAADRKHTATALQRKRRTAKDMSIRLQGPLVTDIPRDYCGEDTRLIVLGHGNPASTHIMGDQGLLWDAKQFAGVLHQWINPSRG